MLQLETTCNVNLLFTTTTNTIIPNYTVIRKIGDPNTQLDIILQVVMV